MRQILIQYPDGEFHTVNVTRFYSIVRNNEESFVVEYDDLTTNKRNYFSVLEKQNGVFVNKNLGEKSAYNEFYVKSRFCLKRIHDAEELPYKLMMGSMARVNTPIKNGTDTKTTTPVQQTPAKPGNRPKLTVYMAQHAPRQVKFPYFIKGDVAKSLGLTDEPRGYCPLTPINLRRLQDRYDIKYEAFLLSPFDFYYHPEDLGREIPPVNVENPISTPSTVPQTKPVTEKKKITVLYDVAKTLEHPYYISVSAAVSLGLNKGTNIGGFYHLTEEELGSLQVKYDVNVVTQYLNVNNNKVPTTQPFVSDKELDDYELRIIDDLYASLADFEDYYKFFGFQNMRDASPEEILNSSVMKELERILNKGKDCENYISIYLLEFLEGFKNELNQKKVLK